MSVVIMGNLFAKQYIVTFSGDATVKADARKAASSYDLKGVKTISAGPYTRVVVFTATGTQMRELNNGSKSDTFKLTVLPSFDHAVISPYGPVVATVEKFDGQVAHGVDSGACSHLLILVFFLIIAVGLYVNRQ